MINIKSKSTGCAKLVTSSGESVVVHRPDFPEAPEGKIYLYHQQRDEVLQYVFELVYALLQEIPAAESKKIIKTLDKKIDLALKQFMQKLGLSRSTAKALPTTASAEKNDHSTETDTYERTDDNGFEGIPPLSDNND